MIHKKDTPQIEDNKEQLTPLEAVHEAAKDLYEAGMISQKRMREYDKLCLSDDGQHLPQS